MIRRNQPAFPKLYSIRLPGRKAFRAASSRRCTELFRGIFKNQPQWQYTAGSRLEGAVCNEGFYTLKTVENNLGDVKIGAKVHWKELPDWRENAQVELKLDLILAAGGELHKEKLKALRTQLERGLNHIIPDQVAERFSWIPEPAIESGELLSEVERLADLYAGALTDGLQEMPPLERMHLDVVLPTNNENQLLLLNLGCTFRRFIDDSIKI